MDFNVKDKVEYIIIFAQEFARRHSLTMRQAPIADDHMGIQLWRYDNQMIDLPTLVRYLKYMKGITIQYFFGTESAIKQLKRI